jgi:hypothetical protein
LDTELHRRFSFPRSDSLFHTTWIFAAWSR